VEAILSKGSAPRRFSVSQEVFAANWPTDWNAREREAEQDAPQEQDKDDPDAPQPE